MNRFSITAFLIAIAAFSQSAAAQNHEQNFDYQPPPMFGDAEETPQQFPLDVRTLENSATPPVDEEPVYAETTEDGDGIPPLPKRRPAKFKASPEILQEVVEERLIEPGSNERTIIKAEKVAKGTLSDQPAILSAPSSPDSINAIQPQAGDMRDITADPLENLLANPSAEEIWGHLNSPDNKPVQNLLPPDERPKDITTRIQANETPVKMVAVRPVRELENEVRIREDGAAQQASAPVRPLDEEADGSSMVVSLVFEGETAALSETDRQMLIRLLPMLQQRQDLRVQIQAFAAAHSEGQSEARRLSLLRAIEIREFLVDKNVDPQRIDLRALGSHADSGPLDRADVFLVEKKNTL